MLFRSRMQASDIDLWELNEAFATVVLTMMEELAVSPKRIIAMQGPFSYEMNRTMFADTDADVVFMKNSGLVGGSDTKLQAAIDLGLHIIVIDRPRPAEGALTITSADEFCTWWEANGNGLR